MSNLLPADEQRVLARRMRDPDCPSPEREAIRARLILANEKLVWDYAHQFSRAHPHLSAEEFFSDGIGAAIHAVGLYDPERGQALSTYVGVAARRQMLKLLDRLPPLPQDEDRQQSPLTEAVVCEPEASGWLDSADVRRLWDRLGLRDRQVLSYRYEQGLSWRQAAKEMGCSLDRAKARHDAALARLRRMLGLDGGRG